MSDQYIHVSDAAEMAGVSPNAIYKHARKGRLTIVTIEGFRMLPKAEVQAYAAARKGRSRASASALSTLGGRTTDQLVSPPSTRKPTDRVLDEPISARTDRPIYHEFNGVLKYLEERMSEIDEELAVYSRKIQELEYAASKLVSQQDACRISLENLRKVFVDAPSKEEIDD